MSKYCYKIKMYACHSGSQKNVEFYFETVAEHFSIMLKLEILINAFWFLAC